MSLLFWLPFVSFFLLVVYDSPQNRLQKSCHIWHTDCSGPEQSPDSFVGLSVRAFSKTKHFLLLQTFKPFGIITKFFLCFLSSSRVNWIMCFKFSFKTRSSHDVQTKPHIFLKHAEPIHSVQMSFTSPHDIPSLYDSKEHRRYFEKCLLFVDTMFTLFNVHFIYKAHNTTNVDHSAVHETVHNNNKITFKFYIITAQKHK